MRNYRAVTMIAIAIVAGLAAAIYAASWLAAQGNMATTRVAVAAGDLGIGQPIGENQIKMIDWPSDGLPPGAITDGQQLAGRVTRTNLMKGEPFLETKLAPKGSKGGLAAVIGEGKRAITVRVNDVVGVAGFALPGNYVDVIVNTTEEESGRRDRERAVSKIVLEKILVLAVAQEASRDETKPKVVNAVTLEVSPREAEKLDLARSVGQLSLVLRNQVDNVATNSGGATKDALFGITKPVPVTEPVKPVIVKQVVKAAEPPPPPAAPAPKRNCVEALIGGERKVECF